MQSITYYTIIQKKDIYLASAKHFFVRFQIGFLKAGENYNRRAEAT